MIRLSIYIYILYIYVFFFLGTDILGWIELYIVRSTKKIIFERSSCTKTKCHVDTGNLSEIIVRSGLTATLFWFSHVQVAEEDCGARVVRGNFFYQHHLGFAAYIYIYINMRIYLYTNVD